MHTNLHLDSLVHAKTAAEIFLRNESLTKVCAQKVLENKLFSTLSSASLNSTSTIMRSEVKILKQRLLRALYKFDAKCYFS
jgi:hypothetical protein